MGMNMYESVGSSTVIRKHCQNRLKNKCLIIYKYLVVGLGFSHLGFWSGNLFLIAPFPDLCLLVPSSVGELPCPGALLKAGRAYRSGCWRSSHANCKHFAKVLIPRRHFSIGYCAESQMNLRNVYDVNIYTIHYVILRRENG